MSLFEDSAHEYFSSAFGDYGVLSIFVRALKPMPIHSASNVVPK